MREDETILEVRVRNAMKALQELKNKQPTAGDGWVVYRAITNNTWDIDLTNVAASYDRLFRVQYVPDDGDTSNGFAAFYYDVDYNILQNLSFASVYRDSRDPYSFYVRVYGAGGSPSRFVMKLYGFSPKRGSLLITDSAP